ncbi:hypothetical protein SARC_14574, partial [Sphaeroforma arctica JP610]
MGKGFGALENIGKGLSANARSLLGEQGLPFDYPHSNEWDNDSEDYVEDEDSIDACPEFEVRFEKYGGQKVLNTLEETSTVFSGAAQRQ